MVKKEEKIEENQEVDGKEKVSAEDVAEKVTKKKPAVSKGKKPNTQEAVVKRLATEKHPTIEAIINGLFRFETEEQAQERIDTIRDHFIISSKLPKDKDDLLKLWIRGYEINKEEEKKGYLGNYASFKIKKLGDGKCTIVAEKQRIAIKYHPQRKRPKSKHPDWGHPCLRIVKKGIVFDTIEEAQKILSQLHEEYPDISIPAVNKLFTIIYSRTNKPPVQKYILEIQPARDGGGFYIEYKINEYKKPKELPTDGKKKVSKTTEAEGDGSEDSSSDAKEKGYFASMVELKRSKKAQIDELRKKKKEEES